MIRVRSNNTYNKPVTAVLNEIDERRILVMIIRNMERQICNLYSEIH